MEKKKQIISEFDHLVEESNAFREPLMKVFTRKIKRVKKKTKENEDDDYDSEEEEVETVVETSFRFDTMEEAERLFELY